MMQTARNLLKLVTWVSINQSSYHLISTRCTRALKTRRSCGSDGSRPV